MSETTVLVCEDEFIIRIALAEEPRGAGYRVLEADNAAAATLVEGGFQFGPRLAFVNAQSVFKKARAGPRGDVN